eukprot:5371-Heterococcus_DN1.PRE.3
MQVSVLASCVHSLVGLQDICPAILLLVVCSASYLVPHEMNAMHQSQHSTAEVAVAMLPQLEFGAQLVDETSKQRCNERAMQHLQQSKLNLAHDAAYYHHATPSALLGGLTAFNIQGDSDSFG